jgi:sulfite reductase alpha subunit-like flavoprotein
MLEELERQWKAKDKEIVDVIKDIEIDKLMSEEEVSEFLKLMKHSEYSVVKQLKKTPIRISLMSLILSSKPHCNALQSVNKTYVP